MTVHGAVSRDRPYELNAILGECRVPTALGAGELAVILIPRGERETPELRTKDVTTASSRVFKVGALPPRTTRRVVIFLSSH